MKAAAVYPDKKVLGVVSDFPEPKLESPSEVRLRILNVGVCGTDREIASFLYGVPPSGSEYLVIGHECVGEVVETGPEAMGLKPGDLVIPMVRRPCVHPECVACQAGRADFCYTGDYRERGIMKMHGFMTEFVVDEARYMNRVPAGIRNVAVLVEPLTIAEKALIQVLQIQERLPWRKTTAVVLGAGPVGLLGALTLRLHGFDVTVYSRDREPNAAADIVKAIGGRYISALDKTVEQMAVETGAIDLVYEAAGSSQLAFSAMSVLGPNGVFVLTGVPGNHGPTPFDTDTAMHKMVLGNQCVFGTVNAGKDAFERAVADLTAFHERWPDAVEGLITGRFSIDDFVQPIQFSEGYQKYHRDCEMNPEHVRLGEDAARTEDWKRWGPYLSERQWGTVREDYSATGECWTYFPHDHARSRAYRWGEDGLMGITDRQGRMCFALALWNGKDPIVKERLFGLTGEEGNHGEDVKEAYFYVDSTPTHSYMKGLYKYPQKPYPYRWLVEENKRRSKSDREFEITDTGVFDEGRYFDVQIEYAKVSANDILIRLHIDNRGPQAWTLHLLPTVWFRNSWSWGRTGEGYWHKPSLRLLDDRHVACEHQSLGRFTFEALRKPDRYLFTENETNNERLFGSPNRTPYVKDAFDRFVVHGEQGAVNPANEGTKAAAYYRVEVAAGGSFELRFRISAKGSPASVDFDEVFKQRILEADLFYGLDDKTPTELAVARQALASMLWSKQFYNYGVLEWLQGDPAYPPPAPQRRHGRNSEWEHLYNRDVLSMPDNWEFPWYASWDHAFHMVAIAETDPAYAKDQLILLLREWYMHPSGQIPAYEFAFSDVNPPVHAWAAWRVYKISAPYGQRDRSFLERVFQKLLLNFTWWVNRKDISGKQIFSGGFLGLDNIGVFDRGRLPGGGVLEQADGSAWMAFYCVTMLSIALELSIENPGYEDIASKFFEHFVAIADAMNTLGGHGLWDEEDGFYYDQLQTDGIEVPLKIRSMVGLIPLFAVEVLEEEVIHRLPEFRKRLLWFLRNRGDLYQQVSMMESSGAADHRHRLLAIPSKDRLSRVLTRLFDEQQFLSAHGVRSLSKEYESRPYVLRIDGETRTVGYDPGESTTGLFGGNSNWRGPVWFPVNYLLIEALERYHHFYGDEFKVECPTGSGVWITLKDAAKEINRRLCGLFIPDSSGHAPWMGDKRQFVEDPHWQGLYCFNEYFHPDTGRGCGADHQTGWTALIARCMQDLYSSKTFAEEQNQ